MQLRCPTGQVEAAQTPGGQHLGDQGQGGGLHAFRAGRPGIHVAVHAGLVAAVGEVHLQGVQAAAVDWREGLGGLQSAAPWGGQVGGSGHSGDQIVLVRMRRPAGWAPRPPSDSMLTLTLLAALVG